MLNGKRILLIIGGGIAAYKSLDLIRRLRERGAAVACVLTPAGEQFVTALSVGSLAEDKVYTDLFSLTDEAEMGHIRLSRDADLIVVAPATANLLARIAQGIADDLASTVLLASTTQILVAPAMNVAMWENEATQANLELLVARGILTVGPNEGDMACGEFGLGRMAEVPEITAAVETYFGATASLSDTTALVTSGPTWEPIDPVRFIANRSSGRQGHAVAAALAGLGADVHLVTGPVALEPPAGCTVVP
ncbi:MAG: bifunctional phosphopantothenoylcysteine decarboxylase/phosphopantothenate--cysteine ligase CoaBC, partial [Alphaproteobacteria bacterium]|nr:bifunctional phosphopantothenoylcysteine decarboxylase/phosphopantothenate--cysteine ligase CoaBC [Alphaproteobacteria bacterium]